MEYNIGAIVSLEDGTKLRVTEYGYGCNECYFHGGGFPFPCRCPFNHRCSALGRKDGNNVIFVKINEE